MRKSRVLFVQLPIPTAGPSHIAGNVPLAAGYLILYARLQGLDRDYEFEILPTESCNYASDLGLVAEIVSREPDIIGFSCYLWNIQRTLWIAERLKQRLPNVKIVLGGPEITSDNAWVLESDCIDFAVVGEGEQTFAELLIHLRDSMPIRLVPGLWDRTTPQIPLFRKPLPKLDEISSPYLHGILNAADERMMMLETIRGCIFKCKFCYYPKSYDGLYFLSEELIVENLRHAREAGAKEVVLLDPTLNQRKDFDGFLKLLARENHDHQFKFFGELRSEGIKPETAKLLRAANFTEVEIGLQSVDPAAQALMDRKNNLKAFERGVEAMMEAGIEVKVDLIIGLPGDTVASVRRGFEYLASNKLFNTTQVFNLAILPGTAFRQEANDLGLNFQPRPPYYVLDTPTLSTSDLYMLMAEAQEVFETEWDPYPEPKLTFESSGGRVECLRFSLDQSQAETSLLQQQSLADPASWAQALTLWFEGNHLANHESTIVETIDTVLTANPHSTLQIILEPSESLEELSADFVDRILGACYSKLNYLDRYYSLNPTGRIGSKRVLIVADESRTATCDEQWLADIEDCATFVDPPLEERCKV